MECYNWSLRFSCARRSNKKICQEYKMKKSQIALQLYTMREHLTTPTDVATTFAKVKKIGYDAVQLSGMCAMPEEEVAKIASNEGLTICATHEPGVMIFDHIDQVIERLKKLNCIHTAYPYPHVCPKDYAGALDYSAKLENAAQKMAAAGLVLSYHNHACEFTKFDNQILLDIIYNNAPTLKAELDTFWVQAGGCNPVDWIKKYPKRQPLLHLKDFGIIDDRIMRPIGSGNLDWANIIPAAQAAGVEWYIVEQDVCQKDPFESVSDSLNFLIQNFVK